MSYRLHFRFPVKKATFLLAVILLSGPDCSKGQIAPFSIGPWKHRSLNGRLSLEGNYRTQETIFRSNLSEKPRNSILTGQLLLNSNSYIWHPNFMQLNIGMDLNPGIRRDRYIVIPDRSEVRSAEKINIRSIFFNQRPFSLALFTNFNHNFVNRDFATNVEVFRTDYGTSISLQNRIAPLSVSYLREKWDQKELQTGRRFINRRHLLRSEVHRSFAGPDENRLTGSFEDYYRLYANFGTIHNKIFSLNFLNNTALDQRRENNFSSLLWYYHQTGSDKFDRFQASENLRYKLPLNFKTSGSYRYSRFRQSDLNSRQHNLAGRLEHQLFLSLHSYMLFEYIDLSQTTFQERSNTFGLGLDYRKRIPRGVISLFYEFDRRHNNRDNQPVTLRIVNERHVLADGLFVLLDNPLVNPNSVEVTDESGSIIYQQNFDYIIISRGSFLEIQRLPGGQIADGSTVFVDYSTSQQTSYRFDTFGNRFGASVSLFKNIVEIYFRGVEQDYNNIAAVNFRILKTVTERVYGGRFSSGWATGGVEWDNYNSNIIPYQSLRYFLTLARNFAGKANISVTGNRRNYTLKNPQEKQTFSDLSARFIYQLNRSSRINIDGGYRFQKGRGIDLDLASVRTDFTTGFRKVFVTLAFEIYRRDFTGEVINYNAAYLKVGREF